MPRARLTGLSKNLSLLDKIAKNNKVVAGTTQLFGELVK